MNYAEAEAACEELGAHLAVPCSEAENECAQFMTIGKMDLWLGVTRNIRGTFVGVEGTCSPVPTSELWWARDQPNNVEDQDCVVTREDEGWNDDPCDKAAYPLCQLRNCYQPQC